MNVWAKWFAWAVWGAGGAAAPTYSITGTINDSAGAGLDGVTVTLTGDASDSVVTAGGGAYEFTGLVAGAYTLTPTKAGSTFLPASANVTIVGANKTADTMAQVWEITGQILDSAGVGFPDVLVTLTGDASDTDTTDGSGNYSFTGMADGTYIATPTKAGSTFSPLGASGNISGADRIAATLAQVWPITGTILDSESDPVSGVLVTLTGDEEDDNTTDVNGDYHFSFLADGSYVVTPTKSGETFTPTSTAVEMVGAAEVADFEQDVLVWEITGNVVDGEAAGISGVLVTLSGDASDTDTTDGDGAYSFPGLVDGEYTVTPTKDDYAMVPTSEDVDIEGGDEVSDFVGTAQQVLPVFIGFEGDTPPAVPGDWTIPVGTVATMDIINDENAYTPSSFTKSARANISSVAWLMEYDLLPLPTSGKIRIAALMFVGTGTLDQVRFGFGTSAGAPLDGLFGYIDTNASTDGVRVSGYNSGSETIGINSNSGLDLDVNDWKWIRLEIDIDASTGACHHYWHSGPSTGTIRTASFAACGGWTYASTGMKLLWDAFDRAGTTDMILAGFWIGTGDDAWPTD